MLSITKIFHFEAAHAISNHPGRCRNIHGHSYALHISVRAEKLNALNMVMDFSDLKKLVQDKILSDYDHALILKLNSPLAIGIADTKMLWMDQEPTAEYMVLDFKKRLELSLPSEVRLSRIRLYETRSNYAEWREDLA